MILITYSMHKSLFEDKSAISGKSYEGGEGVLVFKHAEVYITIDG